MTDKEKVDMEFYRYEAHETSSVDQFGDVVSKIVPNPSLTLYTYNLYKETPKGYWIGYGYLTPDTSLRSDSRWVSKTAKKRYAYPTKEEALHNYIKRTEKRVKILNWEAWKCKLALNLAHNTQKRLKSE